ncbi:cupredoxin domain-containing protein [Halorhabdus amylolytica]|uniref:cupredoxin domain-containing protein n=1 Tax=Halorhabdus amylolytica TaxID=2559573 RepID=UPI0010AA8891|nr:cupredoxin domain-containing protein [Halorhabdus amylolytica]
MTLRRRQFLGVLVTGAVGGTGGCLDASGPGATTEDAGHRTTVTIRDGTFTPTSLEIAAGHDVTVVFENRDNRKHVLRSDFEPLDVTVPPGETVTRQVTVPNEPGDYEVVCEGGDGSFELKSVPADVLRGCGYDSDE